MRPLTAVALVWAAAWAHPALADTRVWLVGGGNTLDNSQGQIETNVRWLEDLLLANGNTVDTYFGLGLQPGQDVVYRPSDPPPPASEALARVFGDFRGVALSYKRHELRALRGSTAKHELTAALRRDFARLSARDDVLFVYNGHGGLDHADTRNNYLKLWGDERLTVSELEALFDAVPPRTTARFVMTQCYSGAFHALIYDEPGTATGFRGDRCGFMAESALRQAEGCELDLEQTDFRDYTTFFFAALNGTTRRGTPLQRAALDRDRDGAVSYREAHLHALVAATSTDLPRSTSEQFLEDWSPWFLRWDSITDNEASVYWTLADELAVRHRLAPDEIDGLHAEYAAAAADGEHRFAAERHRIEDLQRELKAELDARWPDVGGTFDRAGAAELAAVDLELRGDPRYAELERRQAALAGLGRESLAYARLLTQVEKVYRLRQLARLEGALQTYGSGRARRQYRELLECEAGTLEPAGAPALAQPLR